MNQPTPTRRTITKGALWAAPVLAMSVAAPAAAVSPGQVLEGAGLDRNLKINGQIVNVNDHVNGAVQIDQNPRSWSYDNEQVCPMIVGQKVSVTITASNSTINLSQTYNSYTESGGVKTFISGAHNNAFELIAISAGDRFSSTAEGGYWVVVGTPTATSLTLEYSVPISNCGGENRGNYAIYFPFTNELAANSLTFTGYIGSYQVAWSGDSTDTDYGDSSHLTAVGPKQAIIAGYN